MKKFLAMLLAAAMILAAACCLSSCGDNGGKENETSGAGNETGAGENKIVKIGLIAPLTGAGAQYGQAVKEATLLAVEEINASSDLLDGYTIEVISYDDQTDATVGASKFSALQEAGICALMGPVTTGVTNAVTPLANDYEIVMMTPTATGDNITTTNDYVFRSCFADSYQGKLAADFAAAHGYTKVGAIYATGDDYSKGLFNAFKAECEAKGIEIVTTQTSTTIDQETDFSTQMNNVKAALGENGFLFASYYYGAIGTLIVPQARAAGYRGIIMGADGYDGVMGATAGSDMSIYNNVLYTNHYDAGSTDPKVVSFISAYTAKYGKAPNSFAALAYDGMYMLAKALNDVEKTTDGNYVRVEGSKLQAKMYRMSYSGVTGVFTLDETGTPEKNAIIMEYYCDEDGALQMRTYRDAE